MAHPERVPEQELCGRLERTRAEMERAGVDYLLVGPSTDLVYLIDFGVRQSERLTMLLIPREGDVRLVMPSFELPRVASLAPLFEPAGWADGEEPTKTLAGLLPNRGAGATIGVGAQVFSHFLLRIQDALGDATYVDGNRVLEPVRMRKSQWEVNQLRAASEAADAVFDALLQDDVAGRTERELLTRIHELLLEKGHEAIGGGIVGIGANGASPHHHVGDTRADEGNAVVVDFGGARNNYRSDITRTFHVGAAPEEFRTVYRIVDEANQKAFESVRPGVRTSELDAIARKHIADAGYGDHFLHRLGHGIGLDGHEAPYLVNGSDVEIEPGMTFSIEPGIYLEGRFGVRIEDIVVATENGADRLNRATHELQIV